MNIRTSFSDWLRRSGWAILLIALLQFVLHLWANTHDNFFRDELYYLAAASTLRPAMLNTRLLLRLPRHFRAPFSEPPWPPSGCCLLSPPP